MRKVTQQAVAAFMSGYNFKSGNTEVRDNAMYLHGNKIAEWMDGELWIPMRVGKVTQPRND